MHTRQAELREATKRLIQALKFPREFHLPPQVKGEEPLNPEGTDLYVWKYDFAGKPYAIAFIGKQNKPFWHHVFKDNAKRDQYIQEVAAGRRRVMEDKAKRRKERANFQHQLQEGDILYSSWGYDQTNIDFFQVIDVKGKDIIIREIGSRVVGGKGGPSEKVMAEPNEFVSPPMRKRPQGQGEHVYVKIDESRTAFEWDGRPLHQTGSGYGH